MHFPDGVADSHPVKIVTEEHSATMRFFRKDRTGKTPSEFRCVSLRREHLFDWPLGIFRSLEDFPAAAEGFVKRDGGA